MPYTLSFSPAAAKQLADIEQDQVKLRKVRKALGLIQNDPRYPGLHSHKYEEFKGENAEDVWESYVENKTPGAWRIFWSYGAESASIDILRIGPHPK